MASSKDVEVGNNPSQPANTNTKSPFISHTPRTFVTTSSFRVLYLGRSLVETLTLVYVPSNAPRQFCNAKWADQTLEPFKYVVGLKTRTSNHLHLGSVHPFITGYGFFNNSSCRLRPPTTLLKCHEIVSLNRMNSLWITLFSRHAKVHGETLPPSSRH